MNIDSFKQTTRRLRLKRSGSSPALTVFVANAPASSYDEEEIEAFYMARRSSSKKAIISTRTSLATSTLRLALEELRRNFISGPRTTMERTGGRAVRIYHGDKTVHVNSQFQKSPFLRWMWESPGGEYHKEIDHIIVNRRYRLTVAVVLKFYTGLDHRLLRARFIFTRKGEKAAKFKKRSPKPTINWELFTLLAGSWEDSAVDNIDEEYDRLVQHLHDYAKKDEGCKEIRKRLFLEILELTRQCGAARAAGNHRLTSELAKKCREEEYLKEKRAAVLVEAAEAGTSIRKPRREFANDKTKNRSPTPRRDDFFIQKGNREGHPQFLLGSLRHLRPPPSMPS